MSAYCFVPVLSVLRQMLITFSSLDSILSRRHKIASEYHITWPRHCLPYVTFKNESDLDVQNQDHTKNVMFKIKIRLLQRSDHAHVEYDHVRLAKYQANFDKWQRLVFQA